MLDLSTVLKIRPFSPNDRNAVLGIQNACKPIVAWRQRDYERLAVDPRGTILVAELENHMLPEVLGFAISFQVDSEAELWNIAVAPAYRRQGIGRALLAEICRRLSGSGVQRLFLEVRDSNLPAAELYRSLDFLPLARRRDYYRNPREDAVVLVRNLSPAQ